MLSMSITSMADDFQPAAMADDFEPAVMADDLKPVASEVFCVIPETDLPTLPFSSRLDLIDYFNAGTDRSTINSFYGDSYIKTLTDDYLCIEISAGSTLQLRVLPMGKKYVIAESYTVGDKYTAEDSNVTFLDVYGDKSAYEHRKFFKEPELKDFFNVPKGSDISLQEILALIPYPTIEYSFSADNTDMVARLTIEKYMNTEDFEVIKKYMVPEIRYKWMNKGTYTKSK
jgi:hypothetical protein